MRCQSSRSTLPVPLSADQGPCLDASGPGKPAGKAAFGARSLSRKHQGFGYWARSRRAGRRVLQRPGRASAIGEAPTGLAPKHATSDFGSAELCEIQISLPRPMCWKVFRARRAARMATNAGRTKARRCGRLCLRGSLINRAAASHQGSDDRRPFDGCPGLSSESGSRGTRKSPHVHAAFEAGTILGSGRNDSRRAFSFTRLRRNRPQSCRRRFAGIHVRVGCGDQKDFISDAASTRICKRVMLSYLTRPRTCWHKLLHR